MSSVECYPERSPKIDTLFETLSHNLRREVIHYFENHTDSDTAHLSDIVVHIVDRVPRSNRASVRTSLHHQHLPRLQERGWVDYDTRQCDVLYHGKEPAEELLTEMVDVFRG